MKPAPFFKTAAAALLLMTAANNVSAQAPDLVVTNVAVLSPTVSGQSFTLTYTVANQGSGPADSGVCWYDYVYLCTNTTLSSAVQSWDWYVCGPLAAGGTYSKTNALTLPSLQPGTYYLIAVTDTGHSVPGENYANNTNAPVPFTVTAPDLVVTNVAVLSSAVSGRFFTLTYTVANQGSGPADSGVCWYDYVYLCTNTTLSSAVQSWDWYVCGPLAAGGTYSKTNALTLPSLQPGTYYLIAVTDTGHSVPGENYANNTNAPVPFTVASPVNAALSDNFARDSGLNTAFWTTQSSLLNTIAEYGEGGFYGNTLVAPILSFGPSGMQMSGANHNLQFTGIQSLVAFSPPFTLNTTVTATTANANPFELFLSNNNWTQGLAVFGNVNIANCGYYGIWINSVGGDLLYGTPTIGVPYTIQISVDATGYLTVSLISNGTTLAQQSRSGFTGPFYVILGQGEGTDLCTPGTTNIAVWQYVNVTPTAYINLSNVQAKQRTGTNLVDISYDLSGVSAPVYLSALVSTNDGTNYNIQPMSLSGDGATVPVSSGLGHQFVWNAGADLPNFQSSTMRIQLSVPSGGSFAQAVSPIFTLDTLPTLSGSLTGTVLGNGSPLANAQVRTEAPLFSLGTSTTQFSTSTLSNGTFALSNIPLGIGYVLDVSAAGYAPKRLTGVNVFVGDNPLGDIALTSVNGSYTLKEMLNVNPAITTVEQGGTAYRYYCVVNASGNGNPQPGITVTARTSDGTLIPQADLSSYWPGSVAGVSDGDKYGTVRIAIPSSYLNSDGSLTTIQLSIAGQVLKTFKAQVVPSKYDQVWRHELGVGANAGVGVASVGGQITAESEIREDIVGGVATDESVSRSDSFLITGSVGGGFDVGLSLQTSSDSLQYSGGASASAGLFWGPLLQTSYSFSDPSSTSPTENAMKLYLDLGNLLTAGGTGSSDFGLAFYNYTKGNIEPSFESANLQSVEGDIEVGGNVQVTGGECLFTDYNGQSQDVPLGSPVGVSVSAQAAGVFGYERTFGENAAVAFPVIGLTGNCSVMGGLGPTAIINQSAAQDSSSSGLMFQPGLILNADYGGEILAKNWTMQGSSSPYQLELTATLDLSDSDTIPITIAGQTFLGDWQQYDLPNYPREMTETWQIPMSGGPITYERSLYAVEIGLNLDFSLDADVLGIDFNGTFERGAEMTVERGTYSYWRHYPTESYPAMSSDLFPTETWPDLLYQWIQNAEPIVGDVLHQTITTVVSNTETTVVQAGQATVKFAQGAFNSGAQIFSSWLSDVSHISLAIPAGKPVPLGGPIGSGVAYLPPDGASNYVYGIGGVYRFTSTNAFNGTATLTISYTNADITGLDPTQFQIYQLPDGTNRWQLVGGAVDTNAETVTVTNLTNLGTFAIAPPLPTGNLQLILSTNALSADGTSQMTVTITNLMLNTGNVATQQWLFTATANGAQILNPDCDTNLPGIQVVSTNDAITLLLQAPLGGTVASVSLASVAGDAYGSAEINLVDNTPPATPTNVVATPGQSRIWVSWTANTEPDLAGYRVYYSAGTAGPPWNGTAAIEGSPSPVSVTGTNCLLRGLSLGTNYFVAVSAVDTTGNESPKSPTTNVTTIPVPPMPPTGVAVQFGSDLTNVLMWALSEDDGYNDRDVTQYYIWRAILPGGSYTNIGQVPAGIGIYTDPNPAVAPGQTVSYAVSAVTGSGSTSTKAVATVVATTSVASTNVVIGPSQLLPNGQFQLTVNGGVVGQNYVLLASTNLVTWTPISGFVDTNPPVTIYDPDAAKYRWRFYRIGPESTAPAMQLGFNSAQPINSNRFNVVLNSLPGLNYEIQSSTNLVDWTTITNFVSTNSPFYLSVPTATNAKQEFYRAVRP